ncbi:MAG: hypothetical protein IJY28_10275 [Clostridia bacterium]|nr:hypothetical protein [Clostridia bacterium]
MTQTIRPGQAAALLCTAAAPTLLSGQSTLPGIACGTVGLLCTAGLLCLPPRKKSLPRFFRGLIAAVAALFFLWEAIRSAAELGRFAAGTEQTPSTAPLIAAAVVIAAVWGAVQGVESLARSAVLWAAAGLLLLIPVGAALVPYVSIDALYAHIRTAEDPLWKSGLDFLAGFGGELALLGLLAASVPHLRPRHLLFFGGIAGGVALICTILATGMLGSWAAVRAEPLYTAALSVPPDSAFRPDSLYTVVRIAAHYCRAALFLWGFGRCLRLLPQQGLRRFTALAGTSAAVIAAIWLTLTPAMLTSLTGVFRVPGLLTGLGLLAGRRCAS